MPVSPNVVEEETAGGSDVRQGQLVVHGYPRLCAVTNAVISEFSREITRSCHGNASPGIYSSSVLLGLNFR